MEIKPCSNCLGTDVKIHDCGYNAFNIVYVKCKTCGKEVLIQGDATEKEIIEKWNNANDFEKLIQKQKDIIKQAEKEINRLETIWHDFCSKSNCYEK